MILDSYKKMSLAAYKKFLTDELLWGDLYHVNGERGYITKKSLISKKEGKMEEELKNNPCVERLFPVIVYPDISKYRMKEILTDIPLDIIYEDDLHYPKGLKGKYHNFVLMPYNDKVPERIQVESYLNYHNDVDEYREWLNEVLGVEQKNKKETANNKIKKLVRE